MKNLVWLVLRRERISFSVWLISLLFFTLIVPIAFVELYPNSLERQGMAEALQNPAMIAMLGPAYGYQNYTYGAMFGQQMPLFTMLAVALMNILFVVRHTRSDEELGRIELVRSLPISRSSNLTITMCIAMLLNLILALGMGFGLAALGIESIDLGSSLLYGAMQGVIGILFASITALLCQLFTSSRSATGFSLAVLGVAYLVRAIGDLGSEGLALVSPLGWILRTQVFVNDHWWPVFLTIVVTLVTLAVTFYLNSMRDLGAGLLEVRRKRKSGSALLQSPLTLFFRLQRTTIISWVIGLALLAASYGSVFGDIETFITENQLMQQMFEYFTGPDLAIQFLTMIMAILAMVATIPAVMMVFQLATEEKQGRLEHLLARVVSRTDLVFSTLVLAVVVGFAGLLVTGLATGLASSSVMAEPIPLGTTIIASLVYFPALLVFISIAYLILGWFPGKNFVAWLYLGYSLLVIYFGSLLQFPEWMNKLTPFGYVAKYPAERVNYLGLGVMTCLAVVLFLSGLVGYRKRDLSS